jgi:membrane protein implicated in regulation of membrane protease activity
MTVTTLFLTCALVGGVLLLAQLVFGSLGADHDVSAHDGAIDGALHDAASDAGSGLQLLSVRALSAAVAFFGIGGLGAGSLGADTPLVFIAAALLGTMAMFGVAASMRAMLGLQRDATLDIRNTLGKAATVYVPVPPLLGGAGKVTLAVQGRTVEFQAVTPEGNVLPTGAPVVVVGIRDGDTLEVLPLPSVDGVR